MSKEKMTKSQAAKWLKELKEAIPKGAASLSSKTVDIWAARLTRMPADVLAGAALRLIERHTFIPSLAEILEVCREIIYERHREQARREETMPVRIDGPSFVAGKEMSSSAAEYLKHLEAKTARKEMSSPNLPEEPKLVGSGITDEEWETRKQRLKEKIHETEGNETEADASIGS